MPFMGSIASAYRHGYVPSTGGHFTLTGSSDSREIRILGTPYVEAIFTQTGGAALGSVSVRIMRRQGITGGIDDSFEIDRFTIGAVGTAFRRQYILASRALIVRWADNGGGGTLTAYVGASAP